MKEEGEAPTAQPAIRVIAMPADANPKGNIFGGRAHVPDGHRGGRAATVSSVYASLVKTGTSSMRIAVEAWRRARGGTITPTR